MAWLPAPHVLCLSFFPWVILSGAILSPGCSVTDAWTKPVSLISLTQMRWAGFKQRRKGQESANTHQSGFQLQLSPPSLRPLLLGWVHGSRTFPGPHQLSSPHSFWPISTQGPQSFSQCRSCPSSDQLSNVEQSSVLCSFLGHSRLV